MPIELDCLRVLILLSVKVGEIVESRGVLRVELEALLEVVLSLVPLALGGVDCAKVVVD